MWILERMGSREIERRDMMTNGNGNSIRHCDKECKEGTIQDVVEGRNGIIDVIIQVPLL